MNDTLEVGGVDLQDGLLDARRLGRIVAGARKRAGYDRMADLILALYRQTNMRWHENTVYMVERGERLPNASLLFALMVTLNIRFDELSDAITEDQREAFRKLLR